MGTGVLEHPVLEHAVLEHPVQERPEMLEAKAEHLRALEREEMVRMSELSRNTAPTWTVAELRALATTVDYSPLLPFIREQGGYSCGMQAAAACWDILNEKVNAYSPNLSVNRMIWLWKWIDIDKKPVVGHDGKTYNTVTEYEMALGIPSEGSELTNTDAVQWPTEDGNIESPNFRLAGPPAALAVDVNEIKKALSKGPVRAHIWGNHFVALVGYDDAAERFKFVNSWGDQWGDGGFGYVDYNRLGQEIQGVEQYKVLTPKSLPVARVALTHTCRQDVFLWLGIEGIPSAKRIWPTGQLQDASHNLNFTVTLPRGFAWPPKSDNRLYLDVYDCGHHYESGGKITIFTAAFCGQTIPSAEVGNKPVNFQPHKLTRVFLP